MERTSAITKVNVKVNECSERTFLSCLEPVCLCWRRFGRYFSHHLAKSEVKSEIFAGRAMVDQAREGLCYQRRNLTFLICLTWKRSPVLTYQNHVLIKILYLLKLCYYYAPPRPHRKFGLFMAGPKSVFEMVHIS